MVTDGLAVQGARATAAMVLAYFSQNITAFYFVDMISYVIEHKTCQCNGRTTVICKCIYIYIYTAHIYAVKVFPAHTVKSLI